MVTLPTASSRAIVCRLGELPLAHYPPLRPCPVSLTNLARRNWQRRLLPVHKRSRFPVGRRRLSQFRLSKPGLSIVSVAAFLFRLALTGFGLFSPPAAAVQNPHGVQLVYVKSDPTKKPEPPAPVIAPPGSDLYLAQRGDSIPSVARKYLKRTKYLTSTELAGTIQEPNPNPQQVFLKS